MAESNIPLSDHRWGLWVGTAGISPRLGREHPADLTRIRPLGGEGLEAITKMPRMPPCNPEPHNFQARSAVSAKVDLVSINKGIIARETWLQDGPYPITAVAGLQQPLPCNYPTARRCSAALCLLFLVTEPRARSGVEKGGGVPAAESPRLGDAGAEMGTAEPPGRWGAT